MFFSYHFVNVYLSREKGIYDIHYLVFIHFHWKILLSISIHDVLCQNK
jgi:hypothetical protein